MIDVTKTDNEGSITNGVSTVTVAKPVAKRLNNVRTHSTSLDTSNSNVGGASGSTGITKPSTSNVNITTSDIASSSSNRNKTIDVLADVSGKIGTPYRRSGNDRNNERGGGISNSKSGGTSGGGSSNRWYNNKIVWKDEECFGTPLDISVVGSDFDFEKNLALFDKQALWEEINNLQQQQQKPDVIKQTNDNNRNNKRSTSNTSMSTSSSRKHNKQSISIGASNVASTSSNVMTVAKYRHDENVIATLPTVYKQIIVPKQDVNEYVTDDGLIIPSVTQSLLNKLWSIADTVGLTWDRRVELIGRAATEMALHLLGGGHRMNPRNIHQWPTVVVLCGPHR